MWVLDPPMLPGLGHRALREVNRRLVSWRVSGVLGRLGLDRPVVLTTLPYVAWLIRGLDRRALVYYCTDDYSHWPSADRATLEQADRELGRTADLVLAASQALADRHGASGRCRYFPHGVDFDHFAAAQGRADVPADLARLPSPRIGFFGLIYEKLDFSLLGAVARQFPAASLVMIGPVASCPDDFAACPTCTWSGPGPTRNCPGRSPRWTSCCCPMSTTR